MSLTKQALDDVELAERIQRGWDEVYYGEDWPTKDELDHDQRLYSSELQRPGSEATSDD